MLENEIDSETPWVLPGEPEAVRLMNTIWADRHGVHDALMNPGNLAHWLNAVGAFDRNPRVTRQDLVQARELRDALRRLAALASDDTRPAAVSALGNVAAAAAAVNEVVAKKQTPRLEVSGGAIRLGRPSTGAPVTAALADIALQAVALFTDADAPPVRACLAPGCVLYFVQEHPRREWCSTACGNRARAARHYKRHRNPDGAAQEL